MAHVSLNGPQGRYAYIRQAVRVEGKKNPGHRYTYLGRVDPATKELTLCRSLPEPDEQLQAAFARVGIHYYGKRFTPRTQPRSIFSSSSQDDSERVSRILTVGDTHLFSQLAGMLGLTEELVTVFGATGGAALLLLAMQQICDAKPYYLVHNWVETVPDALVPTGVDWSSAGLSRLLQDLGQRHRSREEFFRRWLHRRNYPHALVCDNTSLSTYSQALELAEWGYNRDHDRLPQVNFTLVAERQSGIPLYFRVLAGSIADVATLHNTAEELRALGLTECSFTLDRGFYSQANVRELLETGLHFLLNVPFTSSQAKQLRQRHRTTLQTVKRSLSWHGQIMRHLALSWEVSMGEAPARRLPVHLYFDPVRAAVAGEALEQRLFALLERAAKEQFTTEFAVRHWLKDNGQGCAALVRILPQEKGFTLERKPNAVTRLRHTFGYMLLLTDEELTGEQALSDYRTRDICEKLLDIMKNECEQNRLHTGDVRVAEGRLFVLFLALILYREVERRAAEAKLLGKYSVAEILAELRKIQIVQCANQRML